MEQVEYPPMSGTNTICLVTVLLETGMIRPRGEVTKLKLETPAGLVEVEAQMHNGKVKRVTFENVPAFAVHLDREIEVRNLGTAKVDVARGGMFYVIADAAQFGLELKRNEARDIVRIGEMVKAAAQEQLPVEHPENPGISGITIAQLSAPSNKPGVHRRNTVIVSTGKWIGSDPRHGREHWTAPPAARELARRWRRYTRKGSCRWIRTLYMKAFSALRSPADWSARLASDLIARWYLP